VLAELVARYAAWAGPDGRVWVHSAVGAAAGVALDPARLTAAAAATDDRCWAARARLAAGVVTDDQLRSGLAAASRISDRIELAGALARRGDRSARALWAELLATRARNEEVVAALRDAPARSPAEDLLLCRALRQSGEREAGLALAHSLLARAPRADLWVEVARGELERVELAASAAALDAAEALPDPPHDDILCLRLRFALQQGQRGQAEAGPAAMARFEAAAARRPVSRAALGAAARLVAHLGDGARAIELLQAAQARADADGERLASAGIRLNLANKLAREGRASEARAAFQESLQIAVSSNLPGIIMRVRAQLVSLETRLGRLGAAESELRALHALVEASGDREGETWLRYRGAWLALAQGRPEAALEHLDLVQAEAATTITQVELDLLRAEALLAMGRPEEALELAQSLIDYPHEEDLPRLEVVLGGAHVALGRRHLDGAVSLLPTQPGELHRTRAGGVLLAAGGEGLDAAGLSVRRARLERAAQLLRGPRAARAATLRDRILDGPGAALDGIVALTEAIHDPNDFPEAVARLVRESLGAHRVLIMVRMPGLGQVTWTELSGAEKSGIGSEVMRRIKRPSDVWVAANAFADPHLRRTSQTVRTFELKSLLAVAIARGDHAIGALYVDDLHRPNRFGPAEVALLQRLGRAVGALLPVVGASRQPLLPRSEPRDLLGVRTAHPGDIERIERALDAIRGIRAAGRPVNILITGPTGAGKTVLADRLAREALGKRGVVALGLQQLPNEMLITNLAGADKGEFTGARDKDGLIERALRSNKALFLDELQDLGRVGQQTLLPLLELPERRFGKLTREQKAIRGDLPILLGTNADVQSGAWRSVFREDLWYRIEGLRLDLPPLGRRGVEAIYQYLAEMLSQHGAPAPEVVFSTRTLERLTAGSWPGNLRQLSAFAALAASRWAGREVPLGEAEVEATVPDALGARTPTPATPGRWSGRDAALLERIWPALERHAFVQSRAADEVGMRPAQLSKILGRNGLRGEVKQRRRAHRGRDPHATPR
jgi:DNA-binding NtrC family response regulator/tetratricopeptide (TPR) repeat protein